MPKLLPCTLEAASSNQTLPRSEISVHNVNEQTMCFELPCECVVRIINAMRDMTSRCIA